MATKRPSSSDDAAHLPTKKKACHGLVDKAKMKEMLGSGDFSDLTIKCNGHERRVHQVISAESRLYSKQCALGTSRVIDLSDHDIETLDCLLDYLYTGDYDDGSCTTANRSSPCPYRVSFARPFARPLRFYTNLDRTFREVKTLGQSTNALMYALGERYNCFPLEDLAKSKLLKYLHLIPNTDQFPELLESVYSETPDSDRGLRDILQKHCVKNAEVILQRQEVVDVMLNIPAIFLDLWKGYLEDSKAQKSLDEALWQKKIEYSENKNKSLRSKMATYSTMEAQMKKSQALIECLLSCGGCRRAFHQTITAPDMDSLTFPGCAKCQAARRL
ncbi:hypothetical protein MMC11_006715 [Xylographa trunciseda]|nr:hypothetical protein [Xylographa trunciseda]